MLSWFWCRGRVSLVDCRVTGEIHAVADDSFKAQSLTAPAPFHVAEPPARFYNSAMPRHHWLVKQEPESYSWTDFVRDGRAAWTGVRNFQARNNLRAMKRGDPVLFYHTGDERQVVGLARVERDAYADPTADEGDWSCVDLAPVKPLLKPVSLAVIKADKLLATMPLVKNSRLSVTPLSEEQFTRLLAVAETKAV